LFSKRAAKNLPSGRLCVYSPTSLQYYIHAILKFFRGQIYRYRVLLGRCATWGAPKTCKSRMNTLKVTVQWFKFLFRKIRSHFIFNKYKTFSVLIYSYINTSGKWENEKLCGNTTPEGRSVFTQFRVFPISTSVDITISIRKNVLYLFYNIAQRNIKKEIFRRFRVDIELYQHGS
jgi:hypothetical protein